MSIVYREVKPDEVYKFVMKFGRYVEDFNCFHFGDGCLSLAAFEDDDPIGFISTYPEALISPLDDKVDAYIDVIEVDVNHQRKGVAREFIQRTEHWAGEYGYRQIRSWSSDDKEEAIPMWYSLNYCLCPAIMYGEDYCPNEDGSPTIGYYVVKLLNT